MKIQDQIRELAEKYRDYTAENLSKLVKTKSYSSKEEDVCRLIVELCKEAGFDEVRIDGLGSVIARVGYGPKTMAFDAHIDTVEVGNIKNWNLEISRTGILIHSPVRSRTVSYTDAEPPTRKAVRQA